MEGKAFGGEEKVYVKKYWLLLYRFKILYKRAVGSREDRVPF